tara:strand:+ start:5419 stop:6345 length:927 start_codon:yes stop_codon:yes gene_type:complete
MEHSIFLELLPKIPPDSMRDWIFFGILIPTLFRIVIFTHAYVFRFRKIIPEKQTIDAAKMINKLEINGLKSYVSTQVVITLIPVIVSIPILWWFEIENLNFSDLDSFPITRIIGITLFLLWFLFELDDSLKTYKKLKKLIDDLEMLPSQIKKNSAIEIRKKLPNSEYIRSFVSEDLDLVWWGTGEVSIDEPKDLVDFLGWLVKKKNKAKNIASESEVVKSVKSKTPGFISSPLAKISKFAKQGVEIVVEEFREEFVDPFVFDLSTQMIQEKFDEFTNVKNYHRLIVLVRGVFPSGSLMILFLFNGLLS